jgi:hypothetical protein
MSKYDEVHQKLLAKMKTLSFNQLSLKKLTSMAREGSSEPSDSQYIRIYYSTLEDLILITISFEYGIKIDQDLCILPKRSVLSTQEYQTLCLDASEVLVDRLQVLRCNPQITHNTIDACGTEVDGVIVKIKINPLI